MKTSALSAPFLEQVEKVVRKELTWGRVYVDTKNENRWYCTIEDFDYLPDENFIYRNMMFVHHNGLRAYLDENSDLIDQQRASLKHMITKQYPCLWFKKVGAEMRLPQDSYKPPALAVG